MTVLLIFVETEGLPSTSWDSNSFLLCLECVLCLLVPPSSNYQFVSVFFFLP